MGILRSDLIAHSQLTSANASVLFDGGDGNAGSTGLKTADSGNKYVIQGDTSELTIECWIYCTSIEQTFDTIWATNNYGVSGNGASFYQHHDGVYFTISGGADLDIRGLFELNKWHHVATTRQWSPSKSTHQWRIYVDGEIVGYNETGNNISEGVLNIGCNNYGSAFPAFEFAGYISNFRMCKRVLYKEKFTPSKFKLKDVSGTVLLCCQDASDDTAVTVGDTLTAGGSPTPGGFGPDLKEDNTDTGVVLEDNTKFDTLSYMVPPGGTTAQSNRGRGLLMGGAVSPGATNTTQIKYFDIASQGITDDFGQTTVARRATGSLSSSTRAVMGGGFVAPPSPYTISDVMDYVTIATTANAIDFGNMQSTAYHYATASNETRGLFAGGYRPNNSAVVNTIDLITIATTGNASNFGDLTRTARSFGGAGSTTRGVFFGGTHPAIQDVIDYVTFSTTGDATDFGNLTDARDNVYGASSSTRAVMAGGRDPNTTNIIDYITIASTGDATDFGDLTQTSYYFNASTSNSIRAVWVGTSTIVNSMEYVTIATTGNSVDWGDQGGTIQHSGGACSDSHGGIS